MKPPPGLPTRIGLIAMDISVGLDLYLRECREKGIEITIPELLRALDYVQADLTEIYLDRHPEGKANGI